jgi:hypothetical protein
MSNQDEDRRYEQQAETFESLARAVDAVLEQYGKHDSLEPGDYSIYEDYWGFPQVKVSINDLRLIEPEIIHKLQQIVRVYQGWEIVVAVAVRGHYDDWPNMGLYIRSHEIVDGLQREYFPAEFQNLHYERARRGTVSD